MAYDRNSVQNVIDALNRAQNLDAKAKTVETAARLVIDDNDDLAITNPAQITAFVTSRRTARDALVAAAKPIVAAWTP